MLGQRQLPRLAADVGDFDAAADAVARGDPRGAEDRHPAARVGEAEAACGRDRARPRAGLATAAEDGGRGAPGQGQEDEQG
jgi:hypothetical protein